MARGQLPRAGVSAATSAPTKTGSRRPVSAVIEASMNGKALNCYELAPFALELTFETIMVLAGTLDVLHPGLYY